MEVVSPSDRRKDSANKVANYLFAGTTVWFIFPEDKEASIYAPGKPVQTITINGVLDGGTVLPGFKLPLKDIFTE